MRIGIYKIKCLSNNKVYIGSSVNIENRWEFHKNELKNNIHGNHYLQKAWNKYGRDNFIFGVIELCEAGQLQEREQYWLDYFGGLDDSNNYNLIEPRPSGRVSREVVEKRRLACIGKKRSNEFKEKRRLNMLGNKRNLGKNLSDETKRKIGDNNRKKLTGKIQPEEVRKKRSESLKQYWADKKAGLR